MSTNNSFPNGLPDPALVAAMAEQFFAELHTPHATSSQLPLHQQVHHAQSASVSEPTLLLHTKPATNHLFQPEYFEKIIHSLQEETYQEKSVNAFQPIIERTNYSAATTQQHSSFNVTEIRKDFPILNEIVNGKKLVWLDNAATTHKPKQVIDRISYYYAHENSNIHRAAHELAARSTDAYEGARNKVADFLHAPSLEQIVFVRGATEAINLVASSYAKVLKAGDEIVISWLEHHANIVPWQMACAQTGAVLRAIPVDETGQIIWQEYEKLLSSKTKLVSITQVSNALGTVTPVAEMIKLAHTYGAKVLVDGAQAVSHIKVDVQALDCDYYVFSGHKVFGPTGIGVLYGKVDALEQLHPYQGGGNMISDVTFEKTIIHGAPAKFEAGTGNIADAVGLGAAIDYVQAIGLDRIHHYEHHLLQYGTRLLVSIPGVRIIGTAQQKAGVLSFTLEGYTTAEVGKVLSEAGIAVRSGHHCAQPILRRFGVEATVRPSLAFYNTTQELDLMAQIVADLKQKR